MNGSAEKLAGALAAIAGEANTSGDPREIQRYAIHGVMPKAAVQPANVEEIAEILRMCAAEKLGVVARGAGTKIGMGGSPERYDVALVTTRLDQVHGYDPGDLTLSVEAGARMADVSKLLGEHGQFLPLSVPYMKQATIGGTVASGVDSPLRQGYGSARDFLLGAEFITGEGTKAKSGGRVVKNVAGYDLHKLFIGSLGTLGILTKLNFKTFPVAEANGGFLATFREESGALDFAQRIAQSALGPATLEILSPETATLLGGQTDTGGTGMDSEIWRIPSAGWAAITGFSGSEKVLRRFEADLGSMANKSGAAQTITLAGKANLTMAERLREAIPLLLNASPAATIVRASVLPSRMGELFAAARRSGEQHGIRAAILARGVGVVYTAFLPETSDGRNFERLAAAAGEVVKAAEAAQGFGWIPWCPNELKSRAPIWGSGRTDAALMRKLKLVFDPQEILSPGRFFGGI